MTDNPSSGPPPPRVGPPPPAVPPPPPPADEAPSAAPVPPAAGWAGTGEDGYEDWLPAPKPPSTRRVVALALCAAFVLLAGAVALIAHRHASKPPWDPSPHAESFAPMAPNDFKLAGYTMVLMQLVEVGYLPYMILSDLEHEAPQTLEQMVAEEVIESRCAWDGWGQPMDFDPRSLTISSAGRDGRWDTADDIVYTFDAGTLRMPGPYWAPQGTMEHNAQQAYLTVVVDSGQSLLQTVRSGLLAMESMSFDE